MKIAGLDYFEIATQHEGGGFSISMRCPKCNAIDKTFVTAIERVWFIILGQPLVPLWITTRNMCVRHPRSDAEFRRVPDKEGRQLAWEKINAGFTYWFSGMAVPLRKSWIWTWCAGALLCCTAGLAIAFALGFAIVYLAAWFFSLAWWAAPLGGILCGSVGWILGARRHVDAAAAKLTVDMDEMFH